ncbi:hypothetical protein NP233_g3271 [Leucocoprinus birnbaumii]|uniref:Uncharacterized protein n=1 Tax=Leucocoprinus birnbaumii TaxID=56174 RepID=A0AAD5W3C4_9AGAR|nr:hypothetical protein NP233_g3271 [Leucocoprinus birnbaumii]
MNNVEFQLIFALSFSGRHENKARRTIAWDDSCSGSRALSDGLNWDEHTYGLPTTLGLRLELFHEILQNLVDDLHTLKQCALACGTLRYIVQQHLFSELTIHRFPLRIQRVGSSPPSPAASGSVLIHRGSSPMTIEEAGEETRCSWLANPAHSHLLSHVRHLKLQCYPPPFANSSRALSNQYSQQPDPSFLSVLELLPAENLNKITILRRYRDDPLSDTEGILTRLLRRSLGLVELCYEDRRVSAAHLAAVSKSIRVLRVNGTEFVENDDVGEDGVGFVRSWPRLESLVFPARLLPECLGWMVVGGSGVAGERVFPRLKNLYVGDECRDVEVVNEVLEMCKSTLRSFVYTPFCYNFSSHPNTCINQNGTVIEFNTPSTLRTLAINCPVMLKPASRNYPNPFGYLSHTLRRLSRSQPCTKLEILHVKFLTTEQVEKLDALFPGGFPIDLCFHEFDKLLSNTTRFPKLRKVYLTVGRHYLSLFRDPGTLPLLNERGMLGIVYEEVSARRFWLCSTRKGGMESVENLLWDGRVCEFV